MKTSLPDPELVMIIFEVFLQLFLVLILDHYHFLRYVSVELNFDFLRFSDVLWPFVLPKKERLKNLPNIFLFFYFIQTVNNRSRFIPLFKHFVKRHAEQRRRDSVVISQSLVRRHSNVVYRKKKHKAIFLNRILPDL